VHPCASGHAPALSFRARRHCQQTRIYSRIHTGGNCSRTRGMQLEPEVLRDHLDPFGDGDAYSSNTHCARSISLQRTPMDRRSRTGLDHGDERMPLVAVDLRRIPGNLPSMRPSGTFRLSRRTRSRMAWSPTTRERSRVRSRVARLQLLPLDLSLSRNAAIWIGAIGPQGKPGTIGRPDLAGCRDRYGDHLDGYVFPP
jgi:hypothetical protein